MRILHYIPYNFHSIDINKEYKSMLLHDVYSSDEYAIAENYSDFKQKAEKMKPEIIHIHACWNISAYRVQHWAIKHRKVVVLSLHNRMQKWHVNHHRLLQKLPLLIVYQRKAIKNADAVLTSTNTELVRMGKIGWNTRNSKIANALTTNGVSEEEMHAKLHDLYQKVIDSNPFRLMEQQDHQMEDAMIRASVCVQDEKADLQAGNISDEQFRKILIHANNEGVLDEVVKGAANMNLIVPHSISNLMNNGIDLFPQRLPKNTNPIERKKTIFKSRRNRTAMANIKIDEKPTDAELQICIMFLNVKEEMKKKVLSRMHLVELFKSIRYSDYDEDMVQRMFKQLGIRKFAARMLQVMKETYHLEEGFMPIFPINDHKTDEIRKQLFKLNIQ